MLFRFFRLRNNLEFFALSAAACFVLVPAAKTLSRKRGLSADRSHRVILWGDSNATGCNDTAKDFSSPGAGTPAFVDGYLAHTLRSKFGKTVVPFTKQGMTWENYAREEMCECRKELGKLIKTDTQVSKLTFRPGKRVLADAGKDADGKEVRADFGLILLGANEIRMGDKFAEEFARDPATNKLAPVYFEKQIGTALEKMALLMREGDPRRVFVVAPFELEKSKSRYLGEFSASLRDYVQDRFGGQYIDPGWTLDDIQQVKSKDFRHFKRKAADRLLDRVVERMDEVEGESSLSDAPPKRQRCTPEAACSAPKQPCSCLCCLFGRLSGAARSAGQAADERRLLRRNSSGSSSILEAQFEQYSQDVADNKKYSRGIERSVVSDELG